MARAESDSPKRRYGGATADERRARRRTQFLDAAVEIIGTEGYRALRIRGLCAAAGLTDRYFYVEFGTLEEVLSAVYAETSDRIFAAAVAAVEPPGAIPADEQVRRLLTAMVEAVTSDRRRARIQLIEMVGVSERLTEQRRADMRRYASALAEGVRERGVVDEREVDIDWTCLALVGALDELLVAWFLGELGDDTDRLVDVATAMVLRALPTGAA
jgi:AcrR family transcriptional regulator